MTSALNITLGIALIGVITGAVSWIIITIKKGKDIEKPGKPVENLIYKQNGMEMRGNLIKMRPVGKNKDFLKIVYASKVLNDEGEIEVEKQVTVAHRSYVIDYGHPENIIRILPKDPNQVPDTMPDANEVRAKVESTRDSTTISEAANKGYENMVRIFKKSYFGEFTEVEMGQIKDMMENVIVKKKEEGDEKK